MNSKKNVIIIGSNNSVNALDLVNKFENKNIKSILLSKSEFDDIIDLINFKKVYCVVNTSYYEEPTDLTKYISENKLFNNPKYMYIVQNKLLTYNTLKDYVKQPKTSDEPFTYPCIGKYTKGSFGKQVELIKNEKQAKLFTKLYNGEVLFQDYVKTSFGRHARACVIGGKPMIFYNIVNNDNYNNFKSNMASGRAHVEELEITDNLCDICNKIYEKIPLDNMGIDFLFGENDELLLCEINGNPYTNGPISLGVDIYGQYVDYIIDCIEKGEKRSNEKLCA